MLIAAAVIAVVCGFIYLSMLWYLGPCLIYSTIIALVVGMGFGGYFLVEHSKRVAAGTQADALTAAGIVVWVCDVIFILVVCFMRKSLKVALTCLKQATLAINDMKVCPLLCGHICARGHSPSPLCFVNGAAHLVLACCQVRYSVAGHGVVHPRLRVHRVSRQVHVRVRPRAWVRLQCPIQERTCCPPSSRCEALPLASHPRLSSIAASVPSG